MSEENMLTKEIAEQFLTDEDSVDLDEFTAIEEDAAEVLVNYAEVIINEIERQAALVNGLAATGSKRSWSGDTDSFSVECERLLKLLSWLNSWSDTFQDPIIFSFPEGYSESLPHTHWEPIVPLSGYLMLHASEFADSSDMVREFWLGGEMVSSLLGEETRFVNYGTPDELQFDGGLLVPVDQLRNIAVEHGCTPLSQIDLSGLKNVSESAAKLLSSFQGVLFLQPEAFPEQVNSTLQGGVASVKVKGLLFKQIAEQFLADEDSVDLSEFTAIEDEAAEILSGYDGDLPLESMANLSVTAATFLAGHKNGDLWMDGITNLSVELATVLIQHPGRLTFDGLPELSVELASALAARTGVLALNGIVNMTTDVAEILAGSGISHLELASLSSLADATIAQLDAFKGSIYFPEPVAKCPECGVALRTNLSKQCFECGASWRDQ